MSFTPRKANHNRIHRSRGSAIFTKDRSLLAAAAVMRVVRLRDVNCHVPHATKWAGDAGRIKVSREGDWS